LTFLVEIAVGCLSMDRLAHARSNSSDANGLISFEKEEQNAIDAGKWK
jgi:hypothetical protein